MKAWILALALLTFASAAALLCFPVFTGTWITKSKNVGPIRAIVFTVGMAETGPLFKIRQVVAVREDQQLYDAIHDAARIARSNGSSMHDARKESRHWGAGRSWCDGDECHRFFIFVGSAALLGPDRGPAATCRLTIASIPEKSRRI